MGYIQNRRKAFRTSRPLDGFTTPQGAWSVTERLLTSYAGALCRVRRSSDSAEMDVNSVAATGLLDTVTMLAWSGSDSVNVTTVYDQSGAGNNFTQATGANQPRMVNAGTVDTLNSLPVMVSPAAAWMDCSVSGTSSTQTWMAAATVDSGSTANFGRFLSNGTSGTDDFNASTRLATIYRVAFGLTLGSVRNNEGTSVNPSVVDNTGFIVTAGTAANTIRLRVNAGTEETGATSSGGALSYDLTRWMAGVTGSTTRWAGKAGTLLFWTSAPSDEASVRNYLRTRYGTS